VDAMSRADHLIDTIDTPAPLTDVWTYNDGGRRDAGFRGDTCDCVTRAFAIATARPYRDVYDDLSARMAATGKPRSARNGIPTKVMRAYMADEGWVWHPIMRIGSGTTVHLRADELPDGIIVARCSRHVCAVIDGVIHDTYDPSRGGTRAVYGYWAER
jgi:hypothetical protein